MKAERAFLEPFKVSDIRRYYKDRERAKKAQRRGKKSIPERKPERAAALVHEAAGSQKAESGGAGLLFVKSLAGKRRRGFWLRGFFYCILKSAAPN